MPAPSQPTMRKFGDYDSLRNNIYDGSLQAVQSLPPVENSRYKIQFGDLGYSGPPIPSLADHKMALVEGRSLSRRLTGNVTMTEKATGNIVDARRMTIASVPVLTQQGVFVVDGSAMPVSNQMRLLPGLYSRRKSNGHLEVHTNIMPGTGVPHRIGLDPETGVFKTSVNQAEIPTISLLKALGATPEELKQAWGEELYLRNNKADKPHHLDRYWEKMGPAGPPPDGVDKRAVLAERIGKYPLDPWVSQRTLGKPYDRYGKEPLLVATSKLLDIARGKVEPDDRDDPIYSTVWGPEHLLAERLSRSGPLLSKMLWQATNTGGLKKVQPSFLTPSIRALFMKSGLALVPEGTNAAEFVDHGARITKVGEGGIGRSADSVPSSSRDVHGRQLGYIDQVKASESESVGVDLRVAFGTRLGSDKKLYAPLKDAKTGKLVFRSVQDTAGKTMGFPSSLNSKDAVVPVIKDGKMTYAPKAEIDYVLPTMEQSFSPLTNLVPLKSAAKAHRGAMAGRMIGQSLPLLNAEAPLVRTQVPNQPGKSFEELYGRHMGAVFANAKLPGTVIEVSPDHVAVRYADGSEVKHERYNNHPSGRKTSYSTEPLVKVGDNVAPGQILAKSNYTDEKGHGAFGKNLRIGFMNLRNQAYEDAIAVSESAAKKLTSDHMYRHDVYADDDVMVGKHAHAAAFPGKHKLEALKTVDDNGVVRPGTVVNSGDPLVLAVRRRQNLFGRLSRSGKSGLTDASEIWDHDEPGVVTDSYQTKNGPVVLVKTQVPLKSGDKLSGRAGNKGVCTIIPDHEMPHDESGKPLEVVISSLGIVSRANPNSKYEALLGKIAAKTGQPYVVNDWDDEGTDHDVGAWVRGELAKHGMKSKETLTDPQTGRQIPNVLTGMLYVMKLHHMSESKVKGRGLGGYDESGQPLRGQSGKAMKSSLGDTNALLSHGACFRGSVEVLTRDGSIQIDKLVKDRLQVDVACIDASGTLVYRPVTGWFSRLVQPSESIAVRVIRKCSLNGPNAEKLIRCTPNHEFFTLGGKVMAKDLTPGTLLHTPEIEIADWQLQAAVGTLMGDAHTDKNKSGLRVVHGPDQYSYLEWLAGKLPNLYTSTCQSSSVKNGKRSDFRIGIFRKHHLLSEATRPFYVNGDKEPPVGIIRQMGWYGIGVWFGDDGSCGRYMKSGRVISYNFATCAFSVEAVDRLAQELSEFTGLPWTRSPKTLKEGKTVYPTLFLGVGGRGGDNLRRWEDMIAPYVPPMLGYKLGRPGVVRPDLGSAWMNCVPPTRVTTGPAVVVSVGPDPKVAKSRVPVYDITVDEYHNYFADRVLVSNSNTIFDDHMYRGQSNDSFWLAFMSGYHPTRPAVSKPFQRFLTELQAAGIDPVNRGGKYHLTALTDKKVHELAGDRIVENGDTLDFSRNGEPIAKGLFDSNLFGSVDNTNQWAKIPLHEPTLNPVFEEASRRLLNLTEKRFRDVIAGKEKLGDRTGMSAIVSALHRIDVPKELAATRKLAESSRKTARDDAFRKLFYLKGLERTGQTPKDWTLTAVPVLPPGFRPVSQGGPGGSTIVHDANMLYGDVIGANKALKDLSTEVDDVGAERLNLYDAVKAVTGLGDPVGAKNRERGVKGVLGRLLGDSAKMSYIQQKLLGTPVNLSGRGQVIPNPDFDMDQIGIPESMAKDVYHPFIIRRLVRGGMGRVDAAREVEAWGSRAQKALQAEMAERPVRATRYPALHRYNVMAFNPVLVKGDAIQTNHIITKGFNMDFNGDSVHTLLTTVAVGDTIYLGDFETFVRRYVVNDYREDRAVEMFGNQTTVFCFAPNADIKVPAVMHNGLTGWYPVKNISIHTSHGPDCYRVETVSGLSSVFTAHHNFLKLSPQCELTPAYTAEIAVGDLIPSLLSEEVPFESNEYDGTVLDFETGVWFGHWLGDGGIAGRDLDTVSHASVDLDMLQYLEPIAPKVWPGETLRPWYEGNRHSIRWTNVGFASWMMEQFGHLQPVRKIPGWALSAPKEFRKGLIVGYCLAEGHAADGAVVCESTSRLLLLGMKMVASTLGIFASIANAKPERPSPDGTKTYKQTWTVNFNKRRMIAMNFNWPKVGKSEQFATMTVSKIDRSGHWDVVPFPTEVSSAISAIRRSRVGPAGAIFRAVNKITGKPPTTNDVKIYATRGSCPRRFALNLVDVMGLRLPDTPVVISNWIKLVDATHLIWEPVSAITKVDRPEVTYDFSVEGAETFCVDGFFLTHNTMTINVPLSDEAVQEARDKLMPSKNLFSPASFKATTYLPSMEILQGLHASSTADENNPHVEFPTRADAIKAYLSGSLSLGTRVRILSEEK